MEVAIIAFTFLFPLYWIITGSFKTKAEILSTTPVWVPTEWVLTNYQNLLRELGGPDIGDVRAPLYPLQDSDLPIAREAAAQIKELIAKYC